MKGKPVYIVCCFSNILGAFESFEDATQLAKTMIEKARPCDICTQIIK